MQRPVPEQPVVQLVLASIGRRIRLLPSDTVVVEGLAGSFVTVELEQPLEVSLTGSVRSVVRTRGGVESSDLRPTLLDWAVSSSQVRGLLALVTGVFGLLLSVSSALRKLGA